MNLRIHNAPFLRIPDITKDFGIHIEIKSDLAIKEVLIQYDYVVTSNIKKISKCQLQWPAYEKEMMVIVHTQD
jgi:hypothetical protein